MNDLKILLYFYTSSLGLLKLRVPLITIALNTLVIPAQQAKKEPPLLQTEGNSYQFMVFSYYAIEANVLPKVMLRVGAVPMQIEFVRSIYSVWVPTIFPILNSYKLNGP